ncbi:S-layer homology domain-containing protein [Desertibacillus haloalkaliphilus]|uniref:S-layer homology domain-containing protein n=1 Tax=Desertibacillus haloalkaliphilus TaxID=1328930 RepID=UPI001C260F5E|nr:S-layer homology domain-containing protein [Desertibacillus haloalkaliphilus]MBU8905938.1 S-layer homology domain-containing protein [Desertibacillus haloalkaliphilus]
MSQSSKYRKFLAAAAVPGAMVVSTFAVAGAVSAADAVAFSDLENESADAVEAINNLVASGVIEGFPDGTYRPQEGISRQHAAVMFVRAFDLSTTNVTNPGYADVTEAHKYYNEIAAATEAGLFLNDGGNFDPAEPLTRGEAAAALSSAWELDAESDYSFSDDGGVHADAITALVENGVVGGFSDGTFREGEAVNRVHFAQLVDRAFTINGTPAQFSEEPASNDLFESVVGVHDQDTLVVTFADEVTDEDIEAAGLAINHYHPNGVLGHQHIPSSWTIEGNVVTFTDFDYLFWLPTHTATVDGELMFEWNGVEYGFTYETPVDGYTVEGATAVSETKIAVKFAELEEPVEVDVLPDAQGPQLPPLVEGEPGAAFFEYEGLLYLAGEVVWEEEQEEAATLASVTAVNNDDTIEVTFNQDVTEEEIEVGDFKVNHYDEDGELIHVHTPAEYTVSDNKVTFMNFDLAFAPEYHDGVDLYASFAGIETEFLYEAPEEGEIAVESAEGVDDQDTLVVTFNQEVTDEDIEVGDFKVNHYDEAGELIHVHTPSEYTVSGNEVTFTNFDLVFAPEYHDGVTLYASFAGIETEFLYEAPQEEVVITSVVAINDDNTLQVTFSDEVTEEDIELGDFTVNHYDEDGELIHVHTPAGFTVAEEEVAFTDFDLLFAAEAHDGVTLEASFAGEEVEFLYEAP